MRYLHLGLAVALLAKPAVIDKVQDRFVSAPFSKTKLGGLLGERMRVNLEGRLLHVDRASLIAGFAHRPGEQDWIGEHVGKFLHAAANTWEYTHDERLKKLMDRMVRELLPNQTEDGYLGTYLDDKRWTSWDVWVHKYDLIGLLSYHRVTGDKASLEASRKIGDLLERTFGDKPGQRDIIQSGTHVGMAATSVLEPMVMLYRATGEQRYLDFCLYLLRASDRPNSPQIVRSLEETGSVFHTANAKAYEMLSNLVGLVELYRVTANDAYLKTALTAWKDVREKRLYITGTSSSKEYFRDDGVLPADEEAEVGEGCVTVTWLQLSWQLLRITGEPQYGEEIERTVYNQLLGAQDRHNGNICYFTPMVGEKKPTPGINCCVSSEPRGISMIPQLAWGAREKGIALLLYSPGSTTIALEGNDVGLQAETKYPLDGKVVLTVNPSHAASFPLALRVPAWTGKYTASVGDQTYTGRPGEFLTIEREWKTGDRVKIDIEMTVRVLPGGLSYPDFIAIARGPQVLALDKEANPKLHDLAAAIPKVSGGVHLRDASAKLSGSQAYAIDGENGTELILVPFADARVVRVWLRKQG